MEDAKQSNDFWSFMLVEKFESAEWATSWVDPDGSRGPFEPEFEAFPTIRVLWGCC